MREREDELEQRGEKCQLCKKKNAKVEYICSDCPFRLLCQACADRHKKLPVLQSHNIVPLERKRTNEPEDHEKCVKHDQLLEYFCSHCEDALCAVCLFEPTHEGHSDKITDRVSGIALFEESFNEILSTFKAESKYLPFSVFIIRENDKSFNKVYEMLTHKCQSLKILLNTLKKHKATVLESTHLSNKALHEIELHWEQVQKHMADTDGLQKEKENLKTFSYNSKEWCTKSTQLTRVTNEILNQKMNYLNINYFSNFLSKIVIPDVSKLEFNESTVSEKIECVLRDKGRNLVLKIQESATLKLEDPAEVISLGDGTVFLVDKGLNLLRKIDPQGKVTSHFYRREFQSIKSACVNSPSLFVTDGINSIVKWEFGVHGRIHQCKLQFVQSADYISTVDGNIIIITECREVGRILEYNITEKSTELRVQAITFPGKVCACPTETGVKYLVSVKDFTDTVTSSKIQIYDNNWFYITSIDSCDKLPFSAQLVGPIVTSRGNVLIHDRESLIVYNNEGTVVRGLNNLIYQKNSPLDIAVHSSHLWVLEKKQKCVSVYQLDKPI